jgi:hypothetical protein
VTLRFARQSGALTERITLGHFDQSSRNAGRNDEQRRRAARPPLLSTAKIGRTIDFNLNELSWFIGKDIGCSDWCVLQVLQRLA